MKLKNIMIACIVLVAGISVVCAIDPGTHITISPQAGNVSFYNNSSYININWTANEAANITIQFERWNSTYNSTDLIFDLGEVSGSATNDTNITTANYTTPGMYRAVMFDSSNAELCAYWIVVRDNTSANYEALHGSSRFADADAVPSVSFVEDITGVCTVWTTDSISEAHSIEFWEFNGSAWSYAAGGNYTELTYVNTSANVTNFDLGYNYTLGNTYIAFLFSHDYEMLDVHFAEAVVPISNVVTVYAEDVETGEAILVFTATITDVTTSSSDGKAIFTNVPNGERLIVVQADDYQTGTSTVYMASSYINETVYLLRYSPFTQPHYVRFKLLDVFGTVYADVDVDVNYTATDGEYASMTGVTGTDGAVTFLMTPSIPYTLTFTNATMGVNEVITIEPRDSEYYIYVGTLDFSLDTGATITGAGIDYWWTKTRINMTHGWINFTFIDESNSTTFIEIWTNQSINNSYNAPINYANTTANGTWVPNSSWTYNYTVDASNTTYVTHFSAVNPDFPSLAGSGSAVIDFLYALRIDLGWAESWMYATTALAILFFISLIFGAATAHIGAIIVTLSGWFFWYCGWFSEAAGVSFVMLCLATVLSVTYAMRKGESLKA